MDQDRNISSIITRQSSATRHPFYTPSPHDLLYELLNRERQPTNTTTPSQTRSSPGPPPDCMVDNDPRRIAPDLQPALTKLSCFTVCETPSGDARDLLTRRNRDDFVAEVLKVCWAISGNTRSSPATILSWKFLRYVVPTPCNATKANALTEVQGIGLPNDSPEHP
jgi:hypothetical protein